MKAKHIFILVLCSLATQTQAVTVETGYHKMLADGKTWNYTYHTQTGDQELAIEVKGDTVVGKNKCHKLYLRSSSSRLLYGCYYEDGNGSVNAYLTLDIQKKDGKLVMQPLDTPRPERELYQFKRSGSSWQYADGNSLIRSMGYIVSSRSSRYDGSALYQEPYPIGPSLYELISVDGNIFARVQLTDVEKHDTLETWVSGVGERHWGIMEPVPGVGKDKGGEWIEFEYCSDSRPVFTKSDFDAEAMRLDYRPFVETNKTWTCSTNPYGADIYYYHLQGDTLIDNQQCLKLYSQNRYNDGTTRYEGALRENDKRVFLYKPGSAQPALLYDFSLNQGDEAILQNDLLPNSSGTAYAEGICATTDVYGIRDHQLYRIKLFYEVLHYGEESVYEQNNLGNWIEGVGPGSMMDVLNNTGFNIIGGRYGSGIIDCSVNGISIYRSDDYEQLTAGAPPLPLLRRKASSLLYFDLQGRRLSGKPAKGVYIENGRKRVVK